MLYQPFLHMVGVVTEHITGAYIYFFIQLSLLLCVLSCASPLIILTPFVCNLVFSCNSNHIISV